MIKYFALVASFTVLSIATLHGLARDPLPLSRSIPVPALAYSHHDVDRVRVDPELLERFGRDCAGDNPFFVTTCFAIGDTRGEAAVVAFSDTPDDSDHHVLLRSEQVGATYGLAHQPGSSHVYIGAYQKRGSAYGPGGPGAVYRYDLETDRLETFADVPDVGANHHNAARDYWPDTIAIRKVGRTSLGDIDLDGSGEVLFVMNLFDRRIHRFRTRDGTALGAIDIGAVGLRWEDEARPFGLKVWQGRLFHAVVRAAEDSGADRDLQGFVYASDLDGSGMREVASFELAYPRDGIEPPFSPWHDSFQWQSGRDPMPMISDIEFSDDGHMILGIRDRLGDMTFMDDHSNGNPPGELPGRPAGDILLARRQLGPSGDASDDRWVVLIPPPETFIDASTGHGETSFGGLGRVLALDRVVMTGLSPLRIYTGGAFWFENAGGAPVAREELYAMPDGLNFAKANGLGDVERLCPAGIATPTSTSTSTSTPSPTASPSPTPTATATPAATPTPWTRQIYIPLIDNVPCKPESIYTDAVLVLDMSTSMYRSTRAGRSKHEAALDAARRFADLMQLEPAANDRSAGAAERTDRIGIAGFNDVAWTSIGLSRDRAAIGMAIDGLVARIQEGTRIDLALAQGQAVIEAGPREALHEPVMILLTDGLPNRVPFPPGGNQEATVLGAALRVKAAGTRLFTVGLGERSDVLDALLREAASRPGDFFFAPDGEDLADIYRAIAGRLSECP